MRWEHFFDDLEGQFEAAAATEFEAEVTDRSRREVALLSLGDRLRAGHGARVSVAARGLGTAEGTVVDTGPDWLLLREPTGRETLVPLAALLTLSGVGYRSERPGSDGEVGRRLDLGWALRGLARQRAGVAMVLADGSVLHGTIDRVGSDHVDVAEHAPGEPRRAGSVSQVRLVLMSALGGVRTTG